MKVLLLGLTTLFCCNRLMAQSTVYYVSPNGNDKNIGARNSPLKTIDAAKNLVKKAKGPVMVYLRGGTYYLASPVVFIPGDSRKPTAKATYKAMPGEHVVISSAASLQLKWQVYKGDVMQAHIDGDFIFDQFFVNGQLQRMARYPNYDLTAKMLGGTAADAISAKRAARWADPVGGYVHALHRSEWGGFSYVIRGKNDKGEPILEGGWQNNRKMGMHPSYRFVENVFEELDTVNEWYYNKHTKTLYFYPPKGLDLAKARIEVPQLKHLFEFRGSEKSPVTNISIEGMELTQTLRTFMENKEPLLRSDWTTYRGGAVLFEGAVNCSVKNCFLNITIVMMRCRDAVYLRQAAAVSAS
jgi:hypothetical protein